jgi:hypothetical protein
MVRDIGEGGLRFEYPSGRFSEDWWTQIDILHAKTGRVLLAAAACRIVYDISNLAEDTAFTGADIRICGLNFTDLTAVQKRHLQQITERRQPPRKKDPKSFNASIITLCWLMISY